MKLRNIISVFLITFSISLSAQKITLGSCTTADGGDYKGEMASGKPHGKGRATYKNGDWYDGEYVKGRTISTDRERSISRIIINM